MTVSVFHRSPAVYALPVLVPGWAAEFDGAPMQTKYDEYAITASGVVTETATGRKYRFHCFADRAGFPHAANRWGLGDVQLNYLGKRAGAPVHPDHMPHAWAIVRAAWNDLCIAIRDERVAEDVDSLSSQERRARFRARSANREGLDGDKARRASDAQAGQCPDVPATAEPERQPLKLSGFTVRPVMGDNGPTFESVLDDMERADAERERGISESLLAHDSRTVQTIDMTPTWAEILPALLAALTDGTPEGQGIARAELARMATIADSYVAAQKALRDAS